jgi:hypothetical protein
MPSFIAGRDSFPIVCHPTPPSQRVRRAHLSRAGFIGLVAVWVAALLLVLSVSAWVGSAG